VLFVPRPAVPWRYVVGLGVFSSAAQFGLLFVSLERGMPPGLASLVIQLQVLFTAAMAAAALAERPSHRELLGGAVAVAGMALIASNRVGGGVPLLAFALCVAAAASWGVGNVITRRARPPDALSLLVWSSLVVPPPLAVLSLLTEGPARDGHAFATMTVPALLSLLYVAVAVTGFGFGSWAWLLRRHPASRVAPFGLLVPVVGIASAWLLLGERAGGVELAGAAVVLAGLAMIMRALRRPALPATVGAVSSGARG
jgi:O-acetylserine/cysteine efflux transporter